MGPCSKIIIKFLTVMMKHEYIECIEITDDHRAEKIVVNLTGRLSKCGGISPRFDVTQDLLLEKWQNHLPPSHQFGFIALTTSAVIMGQERSKTKTYRRENPWILFLF